MKATIKQFRESATRVSRVEAKGTDHEETFEMEDITNDMMFYGPNGMWGRIEIVRVLYPDSNRVEHGKQRGCYGDELFMLELENASYIGERYEMEVKLYEWMAAEGALEIAKTPWEEREEKIESIVTLTIDTMYHDIAETFDDIKSGDVSPCGLGQLTGAIRAATRNWIKDNE